MTYNDHNISGIDDVKKPNAGRIYDYLLGGDHNFYVDRIVADKLVEKYPSSPKFLRTMRWFMTEAVHILTEKGYTQFLDFASGLPVLDHIHQIAKKDAKVIYSDIDPVTVAYASSIINDNPNVKYLQCNVETPNEILYSDAVNALFDKNERTAIGMTGIAFFIPDDKLCKALKDIYEWAKVGDMLFISDDDIIKPSVTNDYIETYKKMGQPFYLRKIEKTKEIILESNWSFAEPFKLTEDWLGLESHYSNDFVKDLGVKVYGAFLEKS